MDTSPPASTPLLDFLIDRINIGIFAVNRQMECTLWNHFMESHSGVAAASVLGKNLFQCFEELPHNILYHDLPGGGRHQGRRSSALPSQSGRPQLRTARLMIPNRSESGFANFVATRRASCPYDAH